MRTSPGKDHITYLAAKLNYSIALIKRVKSYVPKSDYLKKYNALFLSYLSYCISCWGGISEYKRSTMFAIPKRCVRLLFCKTLNLYSMNTAFKITEPLSIPHFHGNLLNPQIFNSYCLEKFSKFSS